MHCIVLNGDYSYLNTINWKKAVCLMVKQKVEVLKYSDKCIVNYDRDKKIQIPLVIRLIKIVRMIYKNKVSYSKRNVFVRDKHRCMYCGKKHQQLTVDHVIPRSRGGKSSFDNCVAACRDCNLKKGNKTPTEAKMFLKRQPYTPTIYEFIKIKMKQYNVDDFLEDLGAY